MPDRVYCFIDDRRIPHVKALPARMQRKDVTLGFMKRLIGGEYAYFMQEFFSVWDQGKQKYSSLSTYFVVPRIDENRRYYWLRIPQCLV